MEITQKLHNVEVIHTDEYALYIKLDHQVYRIAWEKCSPKLACATQAERALIHVSPSGYGLHWPLIDEDLAIHPLRKVATPVDSVLPVATDTLHHVQV